MFYDIVETESKYKCEIQMNFREKNKICKRLLLKTKVGIDREVDDNLKFEKSISELFNHLMLNFQNVNFERGGPRSGGI